LSQLADRLQADYKSALKARDEFRVGVLRMLLAKVKDLQIQQGRDEPLGDDKISQALASYAKQRAESAEVFRQAGRQDIHDKEMRERDIVLAYLPKQLDDEGIRAVLREVIAATGATSAREMGKVMGAAMARLKGQADGTRVQQLVKELLSPEAG
jgi:uncharacterized protein